MNSGFQFRVDGFRGFRGLVCSRHIGIRGDGRCCAGLLKRRRVAHIGEASADALIPRFKTLD
ncbi:hypothetical protein BRPE64_ACDS10090 [Caballeronia insecticola]|uniref:Uncharacterized protein n=1 Tax=Caballeronia insecticola TaxID=758793 RepID=R4WG34_9BURK|nr:hypothetical protein BRPE64_ACDS10090 [Caballeronia insecticola]